MDHQSILEKRAAHYAYLMTVMPELARRMAWSRAEIEAFQLKTLREMLAYAKAHSPWHRPHLEGIDCETATLADLAKLPVMTKADLMEHWDEIVTIPGATRAEAEQAMRDMKDQFYIWGDHVLMSSGGSSGRPGLFVYDWEGVAANWGGMARSLGKYLLARNPDGTVAPMRTVAIGAEMSLHGSFVVARIFSNPKNETYMLSGWRHVEELIPRLNELQPAVVSCYPHLVPALAAAAQSGALTIAPKVMAFGGEPFPDENRALARKTWPQTAIVTCWGTSEGGGTFPCPNGDGFHVCEDQVIIQPVDENGEPVAPGTHSSAIYFTNIYNKALPILRYYIDDVFEMDPNPCSCGCAFQKVRQVHGRDFEKFHYGKTIVHPITLQLAVLEQPQILEYQFRQTENGVHLLYRASGPVDEARLLTKMAETLASYSLKGMTVSVEAVDKVERTKAGKLRKFVSLGG